MLCQVNLCELQNCKCTSHQQQILATYENLIGCLQSSQRQKSSECLRQNKFKSYEHVAGWNDQVKAVYGSYRTAFLAWNSSGRTDHSLFEDMKHVQRVFKSTLRRVRRQKNQRGFDALALSYDGKDFGKFWSMVMANNNTSNSPVITEVNGHCGDMSICELWADVYQDLFKDDNAEGADTTVSSTTHEPSKSSFRVFLQQVSRCVQKLKRGKACGPDGLSAESIQFASPVVCRRLANIFNACLAHSFIPASLMTVTIVPILKKGLNTSKSSNYRSIALAQVISKVL